jgi:hypothetical protein
METFKPYIFYDDDSTSHTYGLWSIRISESMSLDGYMTKHDAIVDLNRELAQESQTSHLTSE